MRHPHVLAFVVVLLVVSGAFGRQSDSSSGGAEQQSTQKFLWTDPGTLDTFDFQFGVGGSDQQPEPPFRFVNEDRSRTAPKMNVIDGRGVAWNIKWGHEARPSTFCTRLLRACGYFAAAEYFIPAGRIDGVKGLIRTKPYVSKDGSFADGRFQLRTSSPKYLAGENWELKDNPFLGTPELQGMKILILLLSNWDTRKSNFGIFLESDADRDRNLYTHNDWGAALGAWGGYFTRSKGRCRDFTKQTERFVKGVDRDVVDWGFGNFDNIRVTDVQWLLQYLGKITDAQLRTGLAASGESAEETDCYTRALRQRIQQLERIASVE